MNGTQTKGVILGTMLSIFMLLVLVGTLSCLLLSGRIGESRIEIGISIVMGISVACGSYVSGRLSNKARVVNGIMTAIILLLTLFVAALCLDGEFENLVARYTSLGVGTACACAFLMTDISKRNKRTKRYR